MVVFDIHKRLGISLVRDFVGAVTLALLVAGLSYYVSEKAVPHVMWFFVYLILLMCLFFCCKHKDAPLRPKGWLLYAVACLVASAILYGVAGGFNNWLAWRVGDNSFDDHPLLALYAGFTLLGALVALSGWVREMVPHARRGD